MSATAGLARRIQADDAFPPRAATTRDGAQYRIRAISADDAGRERAFIGSLSEASLYNRLMYALREPSAQFIQRMVDVDYHETMALVACLPAAAGEPLIAVARYATDAPGSRRAEFAVTVADAWQGRGVGRQLLAELIAYARTRGLATLHGSVLATNQPMIKLARSLGMQTSPTAGNGQLVDAMLALDSTLPTQGQPG